MEKNRLGWEVGRSSRMGCNFKQSHQGQYPKKLTFAEGWENSKKQKTGMQPSWQRLSKRKTASAKALGQPELR